VTEASNDELEGILQDLLSAVHEKVERIRILAANQLLNGKTAKDRRTVPP